MPLRLSRLRHLYGSRLPPEPDHQPNATS